MQPSSHLPLLACGDGRETVMRAAGHQSLQRNSRSPRDIDYVFAAPVWAKGELVVGNLHPHFFNAGPAFN